MKKSVLFLFTAFMAISFAANAETYKIPVGEFSEMVLNDKLNVIYSTNPDSVGYVVFNTKSDYASYIMTECNKGRLKIQISQEAQEVKDLPTVYVYSTFLSKVENWRDGSVTIREIKPASKIELSTQGNGRIVADGLDATTVSLKVQSGKGYIKVSGKCRSLELNSVGTGSIDAYGVEAQEVDCRLTGTGSVYCTPVSKLKIRGIGTGKVYYKGNPGKIEKSSLSTVKAIKAEGEEAVADEEKNTTEEKPSAPQSTPSVVDDIYTEEDGSTPDDPREDRKPVKRPENPGGSAPENPGKELHTI